MDIQFKNKDPSEDQIITNLALAHEVSERAVDAGRHPFGAILVGPDHEQILLEQGNIDTVNHAEATLARRAAEIFDSDYLWNCTLYTTVEPCAMCAATAYWANIGRIVFGVLEHDLLNITGAHKENPTMNLPCREVFARGQKPIRVWGPVPTLKTQLLDIHHRFWSENE